MAAVLHGENARGMEEAGPGYDDGYPDDEVSIFGLLDNRRGS